MGVDVGAAVGAGVGVAVGAGVDVGAAVGGGVGVDAGAAIGAGVDVGATVGAGVGVSVGASVDVGAAVGAGVGVDMEVAVGAGVAAGAGVDVGGADRGNGSGVGCNPSVQPVANISATASAAAMTATSFMLRSETTRYGPGMSPKSRHYTPVAPPNLRCRAQVLLSRADSIPLQRS